MYKEDDFIQLSAIQHYFFCKRQCALIHIEQLWVENKYTLEGEFFHEKADEQRASSHGNDTKIERGLLIRSLEYGLSGKADVVEFHKNSLGIWIPFPVEYKLGKPKKKRCDEVQLCAQVFCLEEMLGAKIQSGALYYGKTRHRHDIAFDAELRDLTAKTIYELHEFLEAGATPAADYEKGKCDNCSFLEICLPKAIKNRVSTYMKELP
ncbi:MAG TPA: CRISPR-associated protein Cas4 [Lentisphaeria bacterium]|nr:MAG: CRISPR-associated protein Cas4 [Lentisphaerae bacterium GWF2_38_69]HBM16327.1 CRISPR-associated protein Cas4 [Lentisphaeria bacterium]